jgi:hypothetical protein
MELNCLKYIAKKIFTNEPKTITQRKNNNSIKTGNIAAGRDVILSEKTTINNKTDSDEEEIPPSLVKFLSAKIDIRYNVSSNHPRKRCYGPEGVYTSRCGPYVEFFYMPMTWKELFVFVAGLSLKSRDECFIMQHLLKKCVIHYKENHSEDFVLRINYDNNKFFRLCVHDMSARLGDYFSIEPEIIAKIHEDFFLRGLFARKDSFDELTPKGNKIYLESRADYEPPDDTPPFAKALWEPEMDNEIICDI